MTVSMHHTFILYKSLHAYVTDDPISAPDGETLRDSQTTMMIIFGQMTSSDRSKKVCLSGHRVI